MTIFHQKKNHFSIFLFPSIDARKSIRTGKKTEICVKSFSTASFDLFMFLFHSAFNRWTDDFIRILQERL